MKLNINTLESVVIRDADGKEIVRIRPDRISEHNISGKVYLTIYDTPKPKQDEHNRKTN